MKLPISISRPALRGDRAFTLTEMLVSMAVLSLILVLTTNLVSGTQRTLRAARSSAEQFREARRAFETITRRLSQATLNTYWDYDDPQDPTAYLRQSELHFVAGPADDLIGGNETYSHATFFIAPFGFAGADATGADPSSDRFRNLESLLNAWGYYITWSDDDEAPPFIQDKQSEGIISKKNGFRLMEFRQPSEYLRIYRDDLKASDNLSRSEACRWFRDAVTKDISSGSSSGASGDRTSRVVAENIIAMVIRPVISPEDAENNDILGDDPWEIAPEYTFDSREWQWGAENEVTLTSRNQVPPVLEITLVALDEKSFRIYEKRNNDTQSRIGTALSNLFRDAADLEKDLQELEEELQEMKIDYRVFQANVGLRTAKWSN